MVVFTQESARILGASSPAGWIAIGTVAIGCSFVLSIINIVARANDRRRRLQLIEAALRNPSISPETQRELVQALKPQQKRTSFVLGWLGAFAGIAWLCTEPRNDEFTMAVVLTAMSFAFITLPLALREVDARRA